MSVAACILALAAAAQAPQAVKFDPSRDLEGFDACYSSEFSELYPLDVYSGMLGREMSAAELQDVHKRWMADCASGDAKVAALRADPREECAWLLRHRMAKSSYFSKITCIEDRSFPGFVFFVQRPAKDLPDYAASVARDYGPWLAKLQSVFDEQYTKPLKLERQRTHALWAVAILASEGDYFNFWGIHPNPSANAARACYDPLLRLVVGYEDPFKQDGPPADRRYPILNAFVREMLHAYSTSPDGRPGALWLEEGLASYLAYHEGLTPACLDERRIRPATLETIVGLAQAKTKGRVVLHPIEDLVALKSPEDVDALVTRRCDATGAVRPAENDVVNGFYGQSTLWIHFLHRAEDGALEQPFLKYLRWALSFDAGPDAMRLALDKRSLAALDREFFLWVFQEHDRAFPLAKADPAVIEALFADKRPASDNTASGPTATSPAAPFSPAVLAVGPSDIEAQHGLALLQARAGDLEGAIAALNLLADAKPAPPEDARVAREIQRLEQLVRLRDGFLESLRLSGAKWSTEFQGKKVIAAVSKVEGGFVHLSENRQGVPKIPLAALDLLEIAKQAGKKEEQGNAEPWARSYACVLAEDAKWEKLLKDTSDEARALREDARTLYPERLRAGRAASALNALSGATLPHGRQAGEASCESIRSLLASFGDVSIVQRKNGDLKRLAAAAAEAALADVEPASLLHGKWSEIEAGKVSIVYDFDQEAEAQDFRKQVGYMKEWRKAFKLDAGKEEDSSWRVRDGSFEGVGAACYRFALAFSAPMTVRYELRVSDAEAGRTAQVDFFVGICDDGKQNCILSSNFGHLKVRDSGQGVDTDVRRPEGFSYFVETPYRLEVRHDGTTVSVWIDGEKSAEAPCATRKGGGVFLWFHTTMPIAIQRLEIEGKVDPASIQALRATCAGKKLAEMGFL